MCISGFTSLQRGLWESASAGRIAKLPWMRIGSGNRLADLQELYCGGEELDKSLVKIFVEGTLDEVREKFQVSLLFLSRKKGVTTSKHYTRWRVTTEL